MNKLRLKDPGLFRTKGFIGEWCDAESNKTYEVINPATGEAIATLPNMDGVDVKKAVDLAAETFLTWKNFTVDERGAILRRWAELIREHKDDIGRILTLEQGKTHAESVGEIVYSASYLDWFAEEIARPSGRIIPAHNKDQRIMVTHEPLGVGATITPWNFPSLMVLRGVARHWPQGVRWCSNHQVIRHSLRWLLQNLPIELDCHLGYFQ